MEPLRKPSGSMVQAGGAAADSPGEPPKQEAALPQKPDAKSPRHKATLDRPRPYPPIPEPPFFAPGSTEALSVVWTQVTRLPQIAKVIELCN